MRLVESIWDAVGSSQHGDWLKNLSFGDTDLMRRWAVLMEGYITHLKEESMRADETYLRTVELIPALGRILQTPGVDQRQKDRLVEKWAQLVSTDSEYQKDVGFTMINFLSALSQKEGISHETTA